MLVLMADFCSDFDRRVSECVCVHVCVCGGGGEGGWGTVLNPPALNPSSLRPSSDRWGLSSACSSIASLDAYSMVILPMAKCTWVDLISATRTASKPTCTGARSSHRNSSPRNMPETDHHWQTMVKQASAMFLGNVASESICSFKPSTQCNISSNNKLPVPSLLPVCASGLGLQNHL